MTRRARLVAWAELLRVSALFTVPGDAVAGAASIGVRPNRGTALAVGASLCLYEAGMALNDWADRAEDAVDRPHRPIPSGRVTPRAALAASAGLTVAGLALAAGAGRRALGTATALAATIWAYDLHLKHTPAAPAAMATARSLDLLLGATATAAAARTGVGRAELFSPHPAPSRLRHLRLRRVRGSAPDPGPQSPDGLDLPAPVLIPRAKRAFRAKPGHPAESGLAAERGFAAGPGHPAGPGFAVEPGHPAGPGFAVEPGHPAEPGFAVEPGLAAGPGHPAEPLLAGLPRLPAGAGSPGAVAHFRVRQLSARPAFEDRGLGRSPSRGGAANVTAGKGRVGEKLRRTGPGPARAAVGDSGLRDALAAAAMLGAHTYAVTAVSRRETQGGSTAAPLTALAAAAVLATLAARKRPLAQRGRPPASDVSTGVPTSGSDTASTHRHGPLAARTHPHHSGTPRHSPALPLPPGGRASAFTSAPAPAPATAHHKAIHVAARLATPATLAATTYFRTAAMPLLHAALNPSPPLTQRAVGGGIRAMIPLQAALAARSGAVGAGAALMGLVPIARKLSRKVSPT